MTLKTYLQRQQEKSAAATLHPVKPGQQIRTTPHGMHRREFREMKRLAQKMARKGVAF